MSVSRPPPPLAQADALPIQPVQDVAWFLDEVEPHGAHLRAYLRKQFPRLADVDDVVQEAHLRMWRARRQARVASAKGYLFTIARNVALGIFRREKNVERVPVEDVADSAEFAADVDTAEIASVRQEATLVVTAIERLPGQCRRIIVLRLLQGFSHQEIARQLGISEQTVRVQVARGIKRCAEYLRQRGVERPGS